MARSRGIPPARLIQAAEAGRVEPLYVLLGEEDLLRRRCLEALGRAVAGGADDAGMAVEHVDATSQSMAAILDAARSLPLFAARDAGPTRMVVVRGFQGGSDNDVDLLEPYLDDPVEATCLVFDVPSMDGRRKAAKRLLSAATVVDCAPPKRASDVRKWLQGAARERGFRLQPDAVAYLLETAGADLMQLDQELEKLSLLVGADDGRGVGARDVEALTGRSREISVFELTDQLVAADAGAAVHLLNQLLDDGEAPVRLLAMVAWVVRQLLTARDLASRGCPEKELLGQLGGRWDQRREVLRRARAFRDGALEEILVACAEADVAVKVRRGAAARGSLEALCRRLCSV